MIKNNKFLKVISLGIASVALILPLATTNPVHASHRVHNPRVTKMETVKAIHHYSHNHKKVMKKHNYKHAKATLKKGTPKFLLHYKSWNSKAMSFHHYKREYMKYNFIFTKGYNGGFINIYNHKHHVLGGSTGFGDWWNPHYKQLNKNTYLLLSGGYKNHFGSTVKVQKLSNKKINLWTDWSSWKNVGKLTGSTKY